MDITRRMMIGAAGAVALGARPGRTEVPMSALPFAVTTPTHVGRVGYRVRDADALAGWYRHVLGFQELSRDGGSLTLGAAGRPLLVLEEDRSATPDDSRTAGLFHTAFLLPSRADLGRFINHAIAERIPVDGASDHIVSEALYLTDPEGNGVEIYTDRPKDGWRWDGGQVAMATERMDVPAVIASIPQGEGAWTGAPENTVVGHVHLRVGDPQKAERWWNENFGFDTVARYGPNAVFLSSGGYHHHIGANSWQSRGAGPRDPARSGLAWVEMQTREAVPAEAVDPWGTIIRSVAG